MQSGIGLEWPVICISISFRAMPILLSENYILSSIINDKCFRLLVCNWNGHLYCLFGFKWCIWYLCTSIILSIKEKLLERWHLGWDVRSPYNFPVYLDDFLLYLDRFMEPWGGLCVDGYPLAFPVTPRSWKAWDSYFSATSTSSLSHYSLVSSLTVSSEAVRPVAASLNA